MRTKVITVYDGVESLVYIDRKFALSAFWGSLYSPYIAVAPVFEALSDLERGDGLKFSKLTRNATVTCQDCQPLTITNAGASPDADISIQCADSGPIPDDLASLRSMYTALSALTYVADIVFPLSLRCVYAVPTSQIGELSDTSTYL